MSFFSRLFAKLFGKNKEEAPRVPYTPSVDRPPYTPTGKFQPPEVTVPEHPRIPAITEALPVKPAVAPPDMASPPFPGLPRSRAEELGFPADAYEYPARGSNAWYVPNGDGKGNIAGPFANAAEFASWKARLQVSMDNRANFDLNLTRSYYNGQFPAVNFIHGPGEGREAAFLYAASRLYRDKNDAAGKPNTDMFFDAGIVNGKFFEVQALRNYGEQEQIFEHKSFEQTVADFPDTPVKQAVLAVLNA